MAKKKPKQHRGNTENLRPPWKPGESGNPKGRPKGRGVTDRLKEIVFNEDIDVAAELVATAIKFAKDGDFRFWNAILERTDGKVPDQIEGNGTMEIVITRKPYTPSDDADS